MHGLQQRNPEPLVQGRKNEGGAVPPNLQQERFVDITRKVYPTCDHQCFSEVFHLRSTVTRLTRQDKIPGGAFHSAAVELIGDQEYLVILMRPEVGREKKIPSAGKLLLALLETGE